MSYKWRIAMTVTHRWSRGTAVLALCVSLGVPAVAFGADVVGANDSDAASTVQTARAASVEVATPAELKGAVQSAEDGVETTIAIKSGMTFAKSDIVEIPEGKVIVLDLQGKSIACTEDFVGRPLINRGSLKVRGGGTITSGTSLYKGYGAINNARPPRAPSPWSRRTRTAT